MFNLFNVVALKLIAEQQNKTISPGLLYVSGILPGLAGIAIPLIAAKNAPPSEEQDGSQTVTWTAVPDISSMSIKSAEEALKIRKLIPDVEFFYHEFKDENEVFDQKPEAGTPVPINSIVEIKVSRGRDKSIPDEDNQGDTKIEKKLLTLQSEVDSRISTVTQKLDTTTNELKTKIEGSETNILKAINANAPKKQPG